MRLTVGVLAHVDAGKTTFSERALYLTRAVRSLGRVDHQDTFLDTHPVERARGITVFSGQAAFPMGNKQLYWLDTPGHVDFSTEMERSLSVMDYAILVVSCAEGVQSHTETVWQLLGQYGVPTFVFLNKTDRAGADPERVIGQMRARLSGDMLDLRSLQQTGDMDDALQEAVAEHDEKLLDTLFSTGYDAPLWTDALRGMIRRREVFPVMSGSALEGAGVAEFLRVFDSLTTADYAAKTAQPLTARVYRVRHDQQGTRLCFMKLLTGALRVKDELPGGAGKVNEIRIYHGDKYRAADCAEAGDLIAVPGIVSLRPGDSVGTEEKNVFHTVPMMAADVIWDAKAVPAFKMMQALRILEDEEPSLSVTDTQGHIAVHIMGGIQLEVLGQLLQERFGYAVSFGPSRVLYRETIAAPSIGIGHYEPLKHYAEVHLRLHPNPAGKA
ncbi:MAG: GTP-binding protein [Clostridia bacterium]|nr:GTP-binding protein [Clostridia bacterium]